VIRVRTCATVPCPCGQAGIMMNGMGSRRAAESAVNMALAMVDSPLVDCGQAVVGACNTGGGRLAKLRRHLYPTRFWVLGQLIPDLQLPWSSRFTHIVSVRTIELLITEVCAKPDSVLFEDDEAG
jgi:hypothetical protein